MIFDRRRLRSLLVFPHGTLSGLHARGRDLGMLALFGFRLLDGLVDGREVRRDLGGCVALGTANLRNKLVIRQDGLWCGRADACTYGSITADHLCQ
jgi:hypothetical protein